VLEGDRLELRQHVAAAPRVREGEELGKTRSDPSLMDRKAVSLPTQRRVTGPTRYSTCSSASVAMWASIASMASR